MLCRTQCGRRRSDFREGEHALSEATTSRKAWHTRGVRRSTAAADYVDRASACGTCVGVEQPERPIARRANLSFG